MKYQDLSDRERWAAITAGVKAGYTSLDEIEAVYNKLYAKEENSNKHKFADGGSLDNDDYYNNVLLEKDNMQKQYIKEQLEEKKGIFSHGGKVSHKFGDGSEITRYSEDNDGITIDKEMDDVYVTPEGNYYEGEDFNTLKQNDVIREIQENPALLFNPEYNKWYNYYRGEYKKNGWDFDASMSGIFNKLSLEDKDWIVQNNPSAFNLLPRSSQNEYIEQAVREGRTGAFQRLFKDAGDDFLERSLDNAVTAAGAVSLVPKPGGVFSRLATGLKPGSSFWTNPVTKGMVASEIGGRTLDTASELTTGKDFSTNVKEGITNLTGYEFGDEHPIADEVGSILFNPGYSIGLKHLPKHKFADGGDTKRKHEPIYDSNDIKVKHIPTPNSYWDNYDFESAINAGAKPDKRNHYPDKFKKEIHPTSSKAGTFYNNNKAFELSDWAMFESPRGVNNTLFGRYEQGDGDVIPTYKGSTVLPELTVTPNGNYYHDTYDNNIITFNK